MSIEMFLYSFPFRVNRDSRINKKIWRWNDGEQIDDSNVLFTFLLDDVNLKNNDLREAFLKIIELGVEYASQIDLRTLFESSPFTPSQTTCLKCTVGNESSVFTDNEYLNIYGISNFKLDHVKRVNLFESIKRYDNIDLNVSLKTPKIKIIVESKIPLSVFKDNYTNITLVETKRVEVRDNYILHFETLDDDSMFIHEITSENKKVDDANEDGPIYQLKNSQRGRFKEIKRLASEYTDSIKNNIYTTDEEVGIKAMITINHLQKRYNDIEAVLSDVTAVYDTVTETVNSADGKLLPDDHVSVITHFSETNLEFLMYIMEIQPGMNIRNIKHFKARHQPIDKIVMIVNDFVYISSYPPINAPLVYDISRIGINLKETEINNNILIVNQHLFIYNYMGYDLYVATKVPILDSGDIIRSPTGKLNPYNVQIIKNNDSVHSVVLKGFKVLNFYQNIKITNKGISAMDADEMCCVFTGKINDSDLPIELMKIYTSCCLHITKKNNRGPKHLY